MPRRDFLALENVSPKLHSDALGVAEEYTQD